MIRTARVLAWTTADGTGPGASHVLFACERPNGMVHRVATEDSFYSEKFADFQSRGAFLAYTDDNQIVSYSTIGDQLAVVVYDVARGRQRWSENVVDRSTSTGPGDDCSSGCSTPDNALKTFVIDSRGFGAWVTSAGAQQSLSIHDHRGTRKLNVTRSPITRVSFKRSTLVWTVNGRRRAARLR